MSTPPNKKSLGRGLGNLIGGGVPKPVTPAVTPSAAVPAPAAAVPANLLITEIAVGSIVPNARQPRRDFDDVAVKELSESIRSEGLMQPIVVRKSGAGYELIAGERRWRAFKLLGQKTIPARIMEASDASSAVLALVENLQRQDLNPVDEAVGVASLMKDFNLTQDAVADRLGKPRASIANLVRLLSLETEILGYLRKGQISEGHAKVLLGLAEAAQRILVSRRIVEKGLSVRATEAEVKALSSKRGGTRKAKEHTVLADLQKRLSHHFGTEVSVVRQGKKGNIQISFKTDDELARLLEKIGVQL